MMLKSWEKHHQEGVEAALTSAGLMLWDDTVNESPTPPRDTGNLVGSGALLVNGKNKSALNPTGEKSGSTQSESTPRNGAVFGLDTPYTVYQHELSAYRTHSRPEANMQAGPKFIESKLNRFKDEYGEEMGKKYFKKIYGIIKKFK